MAKVYVFISTLTWIYSNNISHQIFPYLGGSLHEPIEKCKCNLYTNKDDNKENSNLVNKDIISVGNNKDSEDKDNDDLDKETAAFYNIYKSAVQFENDPRNGRAVAAVKYNTINKPATMKRRGYHQVRLQIHST